LSEAYRINITNITIRVGDVLEETKLNKNILSEIYKFFTQLLLHCFFCFFTCMHLVNYLKWMSWLN